MSDLAIIETRETLPAVVLEAEAERARHYLLNEKSAASRRAYKSDFRHFAAWCAARNLQVMPPAAETISLYLSSLADAGMRASTISRRCAAIRYSCKLAGVAEPGTNSELVRATMRGIRRSIGTAPSRKAALTHKHLGAMLEAIGTTRLIDLRDRALLALGFAAALRRSELVALNVEDFQECEEGARLVVRKSKTDQTGEGATIAILAGTRLQPVRAVREWLEASGITEGPLFVSIRKGGRLGARLSDRHVAEAVKARAAAVGLDPTQFSGHSMRAGFVTSAAMAGASIFKIQAISRHKSVDVLSGYVRDAESFKEHAGAAFL